MVCPIMFSSTHHLKIMARSRLELSATIPWSVDDAVGGDGALVLCNQEKGGLHPVQLLQLLQGGAPAVEIYIVRPADLLQIGEVVITVAS